MTFRYRDQNTNLRSHVVTLRWLVIAEFLLLIFVWHGWKDARKELRVHIPPDLRNGAVISPDQPAPANVYSFASTLLQQLNRWENDGQTEYGEQIYKLGAYFTPRFREFLIQDLEFRGNEGELKKRARGMQVVSLYEDRRVAIPADGVWIVELDTRIQETVHGMMVKKVDMRYPLRVVKYDVDPEKNPWGLAIDGYEGDGPELLKRHEITAATK